MLYQEKSGNPGCKPHLDEFEEGLDRPLASILALGEDAVAHVLERRVLGDVEPRAQVVWRIGRKINRGSMLYAITVFAYFLREKCTK
jgi:hypothetical protein